MPLTFTAGPLFNGVEALFSERNVTDPKGCEFRHEKNVLLSKQLKISLSGSHNGFPVAHV